MEYIIHLFSSWGWRAKHIKTGLESPSDFRLPTSPNLTSANSKNICTKCYYKSTCKCSQMSNTMFSRRAAGQRGIWPSCGGDCIWY